MHAPLAPSSAGVWRWCPGSVAMQARYPQAETDDSKAGDCAHWAGQTVLQSFRDYDPNRGGLLLPAMLVGSFDEAGTMVTEEMAEAVSVYTTAINRRVDELALGRAVNIEAPVQCGRVHPTSCFGTPDFWAYDQANRSLYVDDFKYGHGYVNEYENWQMLTYATGILVQLGLLGDPTVTVVLTIHQPRYYAASPNRSWTTNAQVVDQYAQQLADAAHMALQPNAPTVSGKHCRYCTGRVACEASRQSAYWAMEVSTQATALEIQPAFIGVELDYLDRAIKALEYLKSGLEEQAEVLLRGGTQIPGRGLLPKEGKRRWKMGDDAMVKFGQAIGVDVRSNKAITPAEAEKRGIDKAFIEAQTERPESLKLSRISSDTVSKVFNNG